MKSLLAVLIAPLALAADGMAESALAADAPAQQCAARKLKATGKKAGGLLKCWSREVLRPGTYSGCAAKAELKFADTFERGDAKGGCAVTGDADAIETKVDAFVDDVVADLTGSPAGAILGTSKAKKCAASKLRAVGRKSSTQLKCHAKVATSGSLDPSCISRAEASYNQKWDRAEAKGGCATSNDKAAIETRVDAFVRDVVGDLLDLAGTLFVTVQGANKLHSIDAATGDILASADTEVKPVGVEKANGKVYVANETSGTISVFDSATLSALAVIRACGKPHHTAVSPDRTRFYAACLATNQVAVIDTETDVLLGLLTSGEAAARTHQPWPTKDGQRLWVANWETNDITEIDLATDTILRTFPLAATPVEVVVPPDAKTAYVSVPELSKMMVFDLETSQLVAEPTMLAPENIMLSADGKTILSSWPGLHDPTAVSIFDTETLTSVDVSLPGAVATHNDLTPNAKFGFVSVAGPNGVAVVDIEAAMVHAFYPIPGSGLTHGLRYAPSPP